METNPNKIDMLHGGLFWKLVIFALPLAATSILQHLFNSADVAVVGRFAGGNALAAVGANVANVGVFVNFLVGASIGPNVVVATLLGSGRTEEVSDAIHTVVAMAIAGGLVLMGAGLVIARPLIEAIGTPAEVVDMAVLYFRIYMLGIPFITLYDFGAAILRSIGDTKRPLCYMIFSGILNVILNLLFVIVFHLGVAGVAIATSVSNLASATLVLRTLICTTAYSLFYSIIPPPAVPILDDTLTACLLGGILTGIGSGLVLTCGCSGGGLDIFGLCLSKRGRQFTVGKISIGFNLALYGACALLFSPSVAIYSIIYNYFTAIALDRTHQQNVSVQAMIFTKKEEAELGEFIMDKLGRGVTWWTGTGAYTGEPVHVLFVCLSKYEIEELRRTVHAIDPHAFLVVQEGVQIDGNFHRKLTN